MKGVGVLEFAMAAVDPGLKMFDADFMVAAFGVVEGREELGQAHGLAELRGEELDGGLVVGRERGVQIEPGVGVAGHGRAEGGFGWQ